MYLVRVGSVDFFQISGTPCRTHELARRGRFLVDAHLDEQSSCGRRHKPEIPV